VHHIIQSWTLRVRRVRPCPSETVFVPLTVGGGIRDFTDSNGTKYTALEVAAAYFASGADKISIGSDAVYVAEVGPRPPPAPQVPPLTTPA